MIYHVQFPELGIDFDINPIAFQFGSITVRWYGVLIATGFLLAFFYLMKACKRYEINADKLTNVVTVGLITGIVGARLYYVTFYPGDQYILDPISILYINEGGLAIYGGIIGGLLGGITVAKLQKINIYSVFDLAALGFLIGQSLGRWGNFFNQEAFGAATNLPWRMVSENTHGIAVHPCFLYESIWCALGFVLLHIFSKKYQNYNGQVFLLYLVWYGSERFFVEGLRTDSLYLWGSSIKISQVISVATIAIAISILQFNRYNNKKYDSFKLII